MEFPLLGELKPDKQIDNWLCSKLIAVPMLGQECRFILEGYANDPRPVEFHAAVANFLAASPEVLRAAESALFQYYQDCEEFWLKCDNPPLARADIWSHIQLGNGPMVSRRPYGDQGIYISLECGCEWEDEHGLEIVFKNGERVNKIGPYDGLHSNADIFGDKNLEDVVYFSPKNLLG
jgi:hypothetical protein